MSYLANIQEELSLCILFADDMVLVDESRDGVNAKLERFKGKFDKTNPLESCVTSIRH